MNKIYLKFAQNLIFIFLLFIESKASQDYNSFGIGLIDSILKGITFGYKPINRGLELIIPSIGIEISDKVYLNNNFNYKNHEIINSFLSAIFVMNINNNYGISFLDKLIFIDKKISQT